MNWMQVEDLLRRDDRCVLPIGCTEQHAYLSLSTDTILAERVATEAAAPLGVPVFPAIPFGLTPYFMAYPGTVTLRDETLMAVVDDVLTSIARHGFRRIVIVNGHGGNAPVAPFLSKWTAAHPGVQARFHSWWNAPRTWAAVQQIDPVASHASWMENFPWTRLAAASPDVKKPRVDTSRLRTMKPEEARALLGDGNFGGAYAKPDSDMERIWRVAVEETRGIIETGWEA